MKIVIVFVLLLCILLLLLVVYELAGSTHVLLMINNSGTSGVTVNQ